MIKEELEKEAEELIQRVEIGNSMNCFMQLTPDRKQIGEMLVMIAEPREKRIAELEAQIEKMKCCEMCKNHNWQGCVFSSEERLGCINNKRKLFELRR